MEARANIIAREQIQEFICPVTTEIMFEPVMISGCGHMVEGRVASSLQKCPHCRGEEQNNGISVVAAPPVLTSMLARTLAADPALWQQVYLDHDYLVDVLRKEELNTPTGERFIKLLENNSADNLNEQPLINKNGHVEKGKSAIEILASHYMGRNLLRSNEKIRALISDETKAIEVDEKTITDWLAMEQEEKSIAIENKNKKVKSHHRPNRNSLFAGNARPAQQVEDNIWQRVVYGNEVGVLELLRQDANLVTQNHTVIDYSEREVDDATPFQMALRAGDEVMAKKIKDIYLQSNPENGQQVLNDQFNEVFPNGYAAHLEEQERSANQFERDVLNPLVAVFDRASVADLQAALDKRDNGSDLCRKLREFKDAFHALSMQEKVYNPNHLQKVFEKYNAKFHGWYNKFNDNNWLHLDLFWRQVTGWEERYMTANYAQGFCTGLCSMVENHRPLQRTLSLHNYANDQDIQFFPLDSDPNSKLGSGFAVYSYYGGAGNGTGWSLGVRASLYKTYVRQKQQAWENYAASAESSRNARVSNNVG